MLMAYFLEYSLIYQFSLDYYKLVRSSFCVLLFRLVAICIQQIDCFGENFILTMCDPFLYVTVVFQFVSAIPCTCFGIMFSRLLMSMGTSSLLTSTIFNLSLVLSGIFGYLSGPLVAEFGWRRVAFISSLMFGMGMIISSLATSAWFLIFFYSIEVGKIITNEFNVLASHGELRILGEICKVLFVPFGDNNEMYCFCVRTSFFQ